MGHGQLRPIGSERISARPRMPQRPFKDDRCRECRTRDHPKRTLASARESCPHRNEFAPTANRFSLLAEIDRKANQTKWAFDFIQSPNTGSRRRGKRGGKTTRMKHDKTRQNEERRSDGEAVDDLCNNMATLCLDGEETRSQHQPCSGNVSDRLPETDFTFCADGVRHHWMPQFRPNSLTSQWPRTSCEDDVQFPRPLERCLTHEKSSTPPLELTDFKRKESRFFPLSAFLATPDTAARHPSKSIVVAPSPAKTSVPRKQLSLAIPSTPQKAAASAAHRALATQTATNPPVPGTRNKHTSRPASPSPLAQTSIPVSPLPNASSEAGCLAPMQAPYTARSVTPSSTSSPGLTTSPTASEVPSLISLPSLVSCPRTPCPRPSRTPSPPPPCPKASPTTPLALGSWTGVATPETLSPSPLIAKGALIARNLSTTPGATRKAGTPIKVTKFFDKPCKPAVPVLSKLFPPAPLNPTVQQDLKDFLRMGHANPCWCNSHHCTTSNASVQGQHNSSAEPWPDLGVVRSRKMSDSNLDDVLLTPSPLGSEFEDLETTDCEGDFDEEWTVITPDETHRAWSMADATGTEGDDIPTTHQDGSPITWSSGLLTPFDSPVPPPEASAKTITEPDARTGSHEPRDLHPWTVRNGKPETKTFNECPGTGCECTSAETIAVEWPTLQEAMQVKRTRREKRSGTNDADLTRFCNQMVDWMV